MKFSGTFLFSKVAKQNRLSAPHFFPVLQIGQQKFALCAVLEGYDDIRGDRNTWLGRVVRFSSMLGPRRKDDQVPFVDINDQVIAVGFVTWAVEQRIHFCFEEAGYEFIGRGWVQKGDASSACWLLQVIGQAQVGLDVGMPVDAFTGRSDNRPGTGEVKVQLADVEPHVLQVKFDRVFKGVEQGAEGRVVVKEFMPAHVARPGGDFRGGRFGLVPHGEDLLNQLQSTFVGIVFLAGKANRCAKNGERENVDAFHAGTRLEAIEPKICGAG